MAKSPVKTKYTTEELKARHIGNCILGGKCDFVSDEERRKWKVKRMTYENEGVNDAFLALVKSLEILLVNGMGFVEKVLVHNCAQVMIDTYLIRSSKGFDLKIPQEITVGKIVTTEDGIGMINSEDFADKEDVSENETIRWIFENMQVLGVKPSDAPSSGTWALLEELRANKPQRYDFYKTVWPKLLTKEEGDKGGKLNDSGKETIELIERLLMAVEKEE